MFEQRFSHVVCIYFEGINCLHTLTNTSQILKAQNMKTHLNQIELECNLFRGPYQLKLCWVFSSRSGNPGAITEGGGSESVS